MHSIMDPPVGTFAGSIVEPTDVPMEDILPPTEDILPLLLPSTEDILPASDNIPVRFTVNRRNEPGRPSPVTPKSWPDYILCLTTYRINSNSFAASLMKGVF